MTDFQWESFCKFRKEVKEEIEKWTSTGEKCSLSELQKKLLKEEKVPDYNIETPVVYNRDWDLLTKEDDIKLIIVGDNPGKNEQLKINNRYLVGQAGKLADGFFKKYSQLGVDFRKNVLIVNKSPVHTAKTKMIKALMKAGCDELRKMIMESQIFMAEKTAILQRQLVWGALHGNGTVPELWLVGYSELKNKGIFEEYKNKLLESLSKEEIEKYIYVFRHFSKNCFSNEFNSFLKNDRENLSVEEILHNIGEIHRKEIFN